MPDDERILPIRRVDLNLPKVEHKNKMKVFLHRILIYRISSYSFRGNYSFLNLEIQRSQYIRPKVTVHKLRKLYKEIR